MMTYRSSDKQWYYTDMTGKVNSTKWMIPAHLPSTLTVSLFSDPRMVLEWKMKILLNEAEGVNGKYAGVIHFVELTFPVMSV